MGDDLNDLASMKRAGFAGCPADACEEVRMICDYVSNVQAGHGAVRDIITWLLKQRGQWENAIVQVYGAGI